MENEIVPLSPVDKWLKRQALEEERAPNLIDALLKGNILPYVLYRLKFFSARLLSDLLVTLVEFTFFFYLLDRSFLKEVLIIRVLTLLFRGWLWGGLELLRTRIRDMFWQGRRKKAVAEMKSWLNLSGIACLAALTLCCIYLISSYFSTTGITYISLYIFSCLFSVSLGIFARTYHSCVYGVRRVYRPMLFMVVPNIIFFICTIILWKLVGLWTFGIAQIISGVTIVSITLYFTRRTMVSLKLPEAGERHRRRFPSVNIKEAFFLLINAFSFAFIKIEYLVILILIRSGAGNPSLVNLSLLFYVISPFFKGSSDWTRLFYFDYKRIEVGLFSNFRARINSYLNKTSLILGCCFWTLSVLISYLILQIHSLEVFGYLLLFFLLTSLLSNFQMRAYSNSEYIRLLISEAAFIALALFFSYINFITSNPIPYLSISQFCSMVLLLVLEIKPLRLWQEQVLYSFSEWLSEVSTRERPCRVGLIEFNDIELSKQEIRNRGILLKRRLRRRGIVSALNHNTLVWLERATRKPLQREEAVIRFSGTIYNIVISAFRPTGKEALQDINLSMGPSPKNEEELVSKFRTQFPHGIVIPIGKDAGSNLNNFKSFERKIILRKAVRFTKGVYHGYPGIDYHVSAFAPKGELKYIFLIHRRTRKDKIKRWVKFLKAGNYALSLK